MFAIVVPHQDKAGSMCLPPTIQWMVVNGWLKMGYTVTIKGQVALLDGKYRVMTDREKL